MLFHFCRYIFKNQKKAGLQELGPRFTLKLRSLQRGSFDSKFGEYEWIHKVCSTELLVLSITLGLCSHLWVPKYDSHWPLMWTEHFPIICTHTRIWGQCLCPGTRWPRTWVLNGTWVLGVQSVWMQHNFVLIPRHQCLGFKCEDSLYYNCSKLCHEM